VTVRPARHDQQDGPGDPLVARWKREAGIRPMTAPKLLRVNDVAEQLGIHPDTVREMARRGEIPAMKLGSGKTSPYRFRQSSIDAFLAAAEARNNRRTGGR